MNVSGWGSYPSTELQAGSRAGIKSQLQKSLQKALSHHPAFAPLQHKASHPARVELLAWITSSHPSEQSAAADGS